MEGIEIMAQVGKAPARLVGTAGALLAAGLAFAGMTGVASAADWSVTEIQYEHGYLLDPKFINGQNVDTHDSTPIVTLQHASGYSFGDVFFFIDFLNASRGPKYHFNDKDAYGEAYAYFSSAKILKADYGTGLVKDLGVVAGVNYGADPNVLKWLPGGYIDWNVKGFPYLRTQFTAYIDDSTGQLPGTFNAPKEGDSWQADISWIYPFLIGSQRFSFEGHVEYTAARRQYFAGGGVGKATDWVLGQPQLRWDVGYALTGKKDQFFIGTEYQFWFNKLGVENSNESAFQALAVWRF